MIKSINFSTKIILYWDLPDNFVEGNKYIVSVNGAFYAETEKCHIEVDQLLPETDYVFKVEIAVRRKRSLQKKRRKELIYQNRLIMR